MLSFIYKKINEKDFVLNHGGVSGRTAQQFINYMQGVKLQENID